MLCSSSSKWTHGCKSGSLLYCRANVKNPVARIAASGLYGQAPTYANGCLENCHLKTTDVEPSSDKAKKEDKRESTPLDK